MMINGNELVEVTKDEGSQIWRLLVDEATEERDAGRNVRADELDELARRFYN